MKRNEGGDESKDIGGGGGEGGAGAGVKEEH